MPVVNMLNTKYVIYHPGQEPLRNPYNYGNAWFVNDVKVVSTAREELLSLRDTDLKNTAVVRDDWAGDWSSYLSGDSTGSIRLTSYGPEKLVYESEASSPRFAVFSDIYYPKGWNAYIEGEPTSIERVNYILRGLKVPAGENTIEFRFEPRSVRTANTLAIIGGILIVLLAGYLIWRYWGNHSLNKSDNRS
jgi:hypothetical protein